MSTGYQKRSNQFIYNVKPLNKIKIDEKRLVIYKKQKIFILLCFSSLF